jgi:GNAT superfamily N-acetyltransferase
MDLLYRHMETADEPQVRDITKLCHPTWPARPKFWYHANPTIVAIEQGAGPKVPGSVVAYGSYTVDNHPAGSSFIQYLRDSAVHPNYRERGIGRLLIQKRMQVGRMVGCAMFVGMTWPENKPMRAILESEGFHACQTVPNAFPFTPADGIIYINAGAHDHA